MHNKIVLFDYILDGRIRVRYYCGMHLDQNRPSDERPEEELVDVLNLLFAVAVKMGVNVESKFAKKETIIDARKYDRAKQDEL